jgi:ribonuclease HII
MPLVIGTDEAGYGPNLGPLVVSASVWEVPEGVRPDDLYRLCRGAVVPRPGRNDRPGVVMADSKVLYQPGRGLGPLETGVLAALACLGRQPESWSEAWDALAPDSAAARAAVPWYAGYDAPVPVRAVAAEIPPLADGLRVGLAAAGVRLAELRSRAVFPEEFNRLVARHGTKGAALSHVTRALAAGMCEAHAAGPVSIVCDKHGGRNRYRDLLEDHFPASLVEIHGESRAQSVYRFGPAGRRVEVRFRTKAEACLPAALASMASKYLRELAMAALNAFWCGRVPGLRPTAGYPADAKRFKAEIAPVQTQLGIADTILWRER